MAGAASYVTCPWCGKDDLMPGRSLSTHLFHCSDRPLLWDRLPVGRESNKRARIEEEENATLLQVQRQIDGVMQGPHDDGFAGDPLRLGAMPALEDLASNGADYYDFYGDGGWDEIEAEVQAQVGADVHIMDDTRQSPNGEGDTGIEISLTPFKSHKSLPNGIIYQLHLDNILRSHRRVDLNLFDEINECVQHHARDREVDFATEPMYSRKQLVDMTTDIYNLHGLKPRLNTVTLHDKSTAIVPSFDIKTMLLSILNDPTRMRPENIAPNYNPFTGMPTAPVTHIDEIHTGWAWEPARNHYCGEEPDVLPLGLICFYDKTHSDIFGDLSCSPFICVPSFFNIECRCNTDFWFTLGYVPNLSHGVGKADKTDSTTKLQDQHKCIRAIIDQIGKLRDEGYFYTKVMGKVVKVVVWVHIVTGDCSGHNEMCGKYNSNGKTRCPYRHCLCGQKDLAEPTPDCELLTLAHVASLQTKEDFKNLSLHDIDNAFSHVPLSDLLHGIFGITPGEVLHVFGNGIVKEYMFKAIMNLIGPNDSKQAEKNLYNKLHASLVRDAQHQSDRDFPRMSVRGGFGDGTKMAAFEAMGNLVIQLVISHTQSGIDILNPGWQQHRISQARYRNTIKLLLAYERWVQESNPVGDVKRAGPLVADLIKSIKHCFPRVDGQGYELPKMHALALMPFYMLKFGNGKGVSGQTGERALKGIMKDHADRTQRIPSKFVEQIAMRRYEEEVLNYAFEDIRPELGLDWVRVTSKDPHAWHGSGRFELEFSPSERYGRGTEKITWTDKNKEAINIGVSQAFRYVVRKYALDHGYVGAFSVEGFTRFNMTPSNSDEQIQFHATEHLQGGPWYDYAMIQFEVDGTPKEETTSPALILGFFRYKTPGVPTPHFIDDMGMTAEEVAEQWASDSHVYAVVHTAASYLPWSKFEDEFVSSFKFGHADDCTFIVKIDNITDPLCVLKNYGDERLDNDGEKGKYFCVLPRRKWSQYFTNRIVTPNT